MRNSHRGKIPHPYARSATDKNFSEKANSTNANETFSTFIHPPERGICLSHEGKSEKIVKGIASASANPNIPMVGARSE